jgi:hypothetical protein
MSSYEDSIRDHYASHEQAIRDHYSGREHLSGYKRNLQDLKSQKEGDLRKLNK